jgi:hypothetical protein
VLLAFLLFLLPAAGGTWADFDPPGFGKVGHHAMCFGDSFPSRVHFPEILPMTTPFASLSLPTIVAKNGFRYTLSPNDLLVLARSIRREGKLDSAELAWAYAQRYVLVHNAFPTLASFISGYSQPINPRWFPTGVDCKPGGPYYGTGSCADAPNRPGYASIAWEDIESSVQDFVARWARGDVENPTPRATDFGHATMVARKLAGSNPADFALVQQGIPNVRNTFVSVPSSRAWPENFVGLEVGGEVVGSRRVVGTDSAYLWPMSLIGPLTCATGALAFGCAWWVRR